MTTKAQHTPGALRAAEILLGEQGITGERFVRAYATVIDRETAAPELLAALEKQACLTAYYNGHSDGYKQHPNGGLFWQNYLCPEAKAAIAKAEGE